MNVAANPTAREPDRNEWDRIAESKEFRDLVGLKKTFILPAFILFFAQYLGLNLLVGYAPTAASIRVIGTINVAYLFALFQFGLGWVIAALYLVAAAKFDALTKDILQQVGTRPGAK